MALSLNTIATVSSRFAKKLGWFVTNVADANSAVASDDIIMTYDASDFYNPKYSTVAEVARSTSLNTPVSVADAATYTVLAADSGRVHILPNFTSSCTLTLPTAAAGLSYTFRGKAVAADAQNWVFAAGVPYLGGLSFADNDAGAGADEIHAGVFPNGSSNDNMTIVTPSAGTFVNVLCDGTNWIVSGWVNSATIPTFAD